MQISILRLLVDLLLVDLLLIHLLLIDLLLLDLLLVKVLLVKMLLDADCNQLLDQPKPRVLLLKPLLQLHELLLPLLTLLLQLLLLTDHLLLLLQAQLLPKLRCTNQGRARCHAKPRQWTGTIFAPVSITSAGHHFSFPVTTYQAVLCWPKLRASAQIPHTILSFAKASRICSPAPPNFRTL